MVIDFSQRAPSRDRVRVERLLGLSRRQRKADQVSWLPERLIESGAIDRARNFASQLAAAANQEASHALDHLGDSPGREFLAASPSYMVGRDRYGLTFSAPL